MEREGALKDENNTSRPSVLKILEPDIDIKDNTSISEAESQVQIRLSQVPENIFASSIHSSLIGTDQPFMIKNECNLNNNQVLQTKQMRPILPLLIAKTESFSSVQGAGFKKVKTRRDEARRANHNEIERRRRDKINTWILELGKIIPENIYSDLNGSNSNSSSSSNSKQHQESLSKGGVLAKACEYIAHLKNLNSELQTKLNSISQGSDNRQLEEIERLSKYNEKLVLENTQLKRRLDQENFRDDSIENELSRKQFKIDDAVNGDS